MVCGIIGRLGVTAVLVVAAASSGAHVSVWALLMVVKSVRVTLVMRENVTHMNAQVISTRYLCCDSDRTEILFFYPF